MEIMDFSGYESLPIFSALKVIGVLVPSHLNFPKAISKDNFSYRKFIYILRVLNTWMGLIIPLFSLKDSWKKTQFIYIYLYTHTRITFPSSVCCHVCLSICLFITLYTWGK